MNTSKVPRDSLQIEAFLHDTQLLMARFGHRMQHGPKLPLSELREIQATVERLANHINGLEQVLQNEAVRRGLKEP